MGGARVVYVLGAGRSGTTLVDLLLGSLPGFVSCGELSLLGATWTMQSATCGCGRRVQECPFWTDVLEGMVAGADPATREVGGDAAVATTVQREALRVRHSAKALLRTGVHAGAPAVAKLYREISRAAGGAVVVDSSKSPAGALLVAGLPDVDATFVHLVRDPRAVVWSWYRGTLARDHGALPRRGAVKATVEWISTNAMAELVRRRSGTDRWLRVRYEDLARDPGQVVAAIAAEAGVDVDIPDVWSLGDNHTIAGNPMRFHRGPLEIRVDDAWRRDMPARWQRAVGLATAPLRRRYRS